MRNVATIFVCLYRNAENLQMNAERDAGASTPKAKKAP
jgi:hypothetical protein